MLEFQVSIAGDNFHDKRFFHFLLENVGSKYKSQRLANILSSLKAQKKKPRHPVSSKTHKVVYEFWLHQENAIMSTDRRSGRDDVLFQ